jgi:hypothetical protein
MTTEHRPSTDRPPRRGSAAMWILFVAVIAILGFLVVLPWITTAIVVALWGLGGSGSNK